MTQRYNEDDRIATVDDDEMEDQVTEVEVTRAQIEQTRADIGSTLDAIKGKLNPQDLAQQAKETVHDMAANVAEQAKVTVHEVTAHVVQQAKETAHDVAERAKEVAADAYLPKRLSIDDLLDVIGRFSTCARG